MPSALHAVDVEYHAPVLVREVLEALAPSHGKVLLDGTLGGGGHAQALLSAGADVIGFDRDREALDHVRGRMGDAGGRLRLVQADYRQMEERLAEMGVEWVDGILLDLGVSSWQLENPDRGFSFLRDGPLDMRMDAGSGPTAACWIASASEAEMARVFREYGEEPKARRVARRITEARERRPIVRTCELAELVSGVVGYSGGKHPATRVFQALRIAVNDELGALRAGLEAAPRLLVPGGRLAIIAFHSLEDRMVKHYLRESSLPELWEKSWPAPRPNPRCYFRLARRRAIKASEEEVAANPRARSALLRVAERRGHGA